MKHVVRTSDRIQYKRCRRSYDLGGIDRANFVPLRASKPLEFGTDWHEAMAVYYDPLTWDLLKSPKTREVVQQAARSAFINANRRRMADAKDMNDGYLPIEIEEDFNERIELGLGMLENYLRWAPLNDNFTPTHIEVDFEVPIIVPHSGGEQMLCLCHGWPVFYQGRLDGIVKDSFGWYWILEHKTTGQMGDTSHLELDEQTGSYAWAVQHMLGIRVLGVIYSEALKDVPHPPQELVRPREGRNFSVNKQSNTTYELALDTLVKAKEDISLYADFLEFLKLQGNKFFKRSQVHRNQHELEDIGDRIFYEASEMLSEDTVMYPNPGRFNCSFCAFRQVCIAMNDGSDYKFLLEEGFRLRTDDEIQARRARV